MKILITGGAGFIGSHLAEHLHRHAEIRILDNLRTGHRENLAGLKVEFIEGSILDREIVKVAVDGVDIVYHLAAFVSVPESVKDPAGCRKINLEGLLNVLEACAGAGVRKFCFSSSAAVYGNTTGGLISEDSPLSPLSPYAESKMQGEFHCDQFRSAGRLSTVSLRFFNVFGPRQEIGNGYGAAIPLFVRQAVLGSPVEIYGDGFQTRDFIYVKDIVAALDFVGKGQDFTGAFNAGYGRSVTILDVARNIIALTNSKSDIIHLPPRIGDVRYSGANTERLRSIGFDPKGSLQDGLRETVQFYCSFNASDLKKTPLFHR